MESDNFRPSSLQESGGTFTEKTKRLLKNLQPEGFRDWKKIIILLVIFSGIIFLVWAIASKTAGEIASLSLSPTSASVTAGTNFNIAIKVDTKNNNVVAVKSMVNYNTADFELVSYDTSGSAFSTGNACVFNSKPCEIINNDTTNGVIIITLAKPTPGVNTANGQIANLTFKAKKALSPGSDNITLRYIAYGNYTDSDVIFDDGAGTDILSQVTNTRITAILPAPTGLAAAPSSPTRINLSWDAPTASFGITGYKIFRNGTQVGTSATNSYGDTGLTPLTAYQYRISSYDGSSHESGQTSQVSATTLADTTSPSVPAGLASSSITMSSLHLSWTASTDDVAVAGYNIYRNGSRIGTSVAASYNDTGLSPDTTYTYRISAYDAAGNESNQSTAITPKTLADTQAPTVPTNVSATAVSMTQIRVTWTVSTDNVAVTGYNIYRDGTKVGTSATAVYNDSGLAVSSTHSYQVSAYDAKNNESNKSSTVSATTNSDTQSPTVPVGLSGTAVSMTQINLTWTASTDNVAVTGYRIFRNGTQIGTSASVNYNDTGLTKGTSYAYTVLAYDAAGNASAQTGAVNVSTQNDNQAPTVPAGLSATASSMTEVALSWSAATDNVAVVGYRIYRNGTMVKEQSELVYNDTGLVSGTQYTYEVSAYDADGNESAKSAAVSVTTLTKKYSLPDFAALVTDWLQTKASPADVSGDGTVNSKDLGIMMSNWQ